MLSQATVEIGLATFVNCAEVSFQSRDTTGLELSFRYKPRRRTPVHHVMALVADHIDSQKFRHALAIHVFPDLMSTELFSASAHSAVVLTRLNQVTPKDAPTLLSHPVRRPKI
jgi:hypothetical protein